ncbi:MAG: VCBS repeat-containing protein [candidate division Zixibacteria bacterium]
MNFKSFILVIVLICLSGIVLANNKLFEGRIDYPVGNYPRDLTVADFNGDGSADIAVANTGDDNITVMLNDGMGNYQDTANYIVGDNPITILADNFNEDDDIDLVVMNNFSYNFSVLLNQGDGTFAPAVNYTTLDDTPKIHCADFDGDGDVDIGILFLISGYFLIHLNNGDGTFVTDFDLGFAIPNRPRHFYSADFDNDGDYDLAFTLYRKSVNNVLILLNNGDGTFVAGTSFTTRNDRQSHITGGDMNDDGNIDIVVSCSNPPYYPPYNPPELFIFLNQGDGTFALLENYSLSYTATSLSLHLIDLDNDNDLDIIGIPYGISALSLLLNSGDGIFQDAGDIFVQSDVEAVDAGDFDNDGLNDLAIINARYDSKSLSLLFNHGDAYFPQAYRYCEGASGISISGSDFDGDGDLDLVGISPGYFSDVWSGWVPGSLEWLWNNGDGTYSAAFRTLPRDPIDLFESDLDGDGDCDLAVVSYFDTYALCILLNEGDGSFTTLYNYDFGNQFPGRISGADFDNDGDVDLVIASSNIFMFSNNGDGSFSLAESFSAGNRISSITFADLNGDEYSDLVTTNYSDDYIGYVSSYLNNGDGTFGTAVSFNVGRYPVDVCAADFDGDSIHDLAVVNRGGSENDPPYPSFSSISVLKGYGDGSFAPAVFYLSGNSFFPACVYGADYDSDGDYDLAVQIERYNGADGLSVLLNASDGTFTQNITYGFGDFGGSGVFGGDVDDDGDIDLAVGAMMLINTTHGESCRNDSDCDHVLDDNDNCLHTKNPGQADTDGDGVGDECDNCPLTYNPDQDYTDSDSDGIPDACDICFGYDDNIDSDDDGIPNGCDYICGDANMDDQPNVGDAVFIINNVFKDGPAPDPIGSCDVNCDDECNVGDAVYLINHVFKDGPAPCAGCE